MISLSHILKTAIVVSLTCQWTVTPASAQQRVEHVVGAVVGGVIGGIIGTMMQGQNHRHSNGSTGHPCNKCNRDDNPKKNNSSKSTDDALAALGHRGDFDPVLQPVMVKSVMTVTDSGRLSLGLIFADDVRPDYEAKKESFVSDDIINKQGTEKTPGQHMSTGDVTVSSLGIATDNAYAKAAGLSRYEAFNEGWTAERLKVAILNQASNDIQSVLIGNLADVRMADLVPIIEKSANQVARDTFVIQESLALNMRLEDFARTIRETQGRSNYIPVDSNKIADFASQLVATSYNTLLSGELKDKRRPKALFFGHRLRAERVAVECFTAEVSKTIKVTAAKENAVDNGSSQRPTTDPMTSSSAAIQANEPGADEMADDTVANQVPSPQRTALPASKNMSSKPIENQKPAVDVMALVRSLATEEHSVCAAPVGAVLTDYDKLRLPVSRKAIWERTESAWNDADPAPISADE